MKDGLRPGEIGIFVEVAAVENHKVDVFAHVAIGGDAVGGGALRAVSGGLAEFGFAESLGLFGENLLYASVLGRLSAIKEIQTIAEHNSCDRKGRCTSARLGHRKSHLASISDYIERWNSAGGIGVTTRL